MAIGFVQAKQQANAATTAGGNTFTSTATSGNLLICWIGTTNLQTVTAVTGGWTKDHGGTSSQRIHVYSKVSDGTETQFQWTGSVSQSQPSWFVEYSGITNGVLDQFATGSGTNVTSMSTGTTATTTAADEVAVAIVACGSSISVGSPSWTNSFTNIASAGTSAAGRKILSATGTVETTWGTWTTNRSGSSGVFTYKAGTSATDLVIQDATHAHAGDNVVLTQVHSLVVADATHAQAADNQALTQVHSIVVQDAAHGHTADNLALTQQSSLVVADGAHGHTADSLTLTQVHNLAIQDGAHGHTADNLTLGGAGDLGIAEARHNHSADSLTLTQVHNLVIQDARHVQTADNLTLTGDFVPVEPPHHGGGQFLPPGFFKERVGLFIQQEMPAFTQSLSAEVNDNELILLLIL